MDIRGAYRTACLMMLVMLALQPTALATSGWDHYTIEISGGYQIHGNTGMLTVRRPPTVEIVGLRETNNEPIVGYADSDDHLLLCTVPNIALALKHDDWRTRIPFEGAEVWVLEKSTAELVGPMTEADLTNYCEQRRVSPETWISAKQLGDTAMDDKAWFTLFLSLVAKPKLLIAVIIGIAILVFLTILFFERIQHRRANKGNKGGRSALSKTRAC
ncbi:hypothetical protein [Adhaeretor mobilis]|uniref:Uncharacterized protein n=1 Tax=Adhaeretor mobilis TaxID=1930276 RepID=A0A517N360_9BACT|nr:hypothetical protein [Adhaeretor mobilis]QDT01575.1 hypothetical protein HG15A2_49220 [Adhaeretor mobilis]